MDHLTKEDRAQLNALALKGQLACARCTERLLMDGETLLVATIGGMHPIIGILPPKRNSPLWSEAATSRITDTEVTLFTMRFGCEIRWTLSRADGELLRFAGRVH